MFCHMHKAAYWMLLTAFLTLSVIPSVEAQSILRDQTPWMPRPGVMVDLSPGFTPAHLKGIVINPQNVFSFDFIIYQGDKKLRIAQKTSEYMKLIKYFLASLAIPDDDQWVNLSPYEQDRIIKDDFGKTQMGRDLLAQDYMLKQITASLIYPQHHLGQEFWSRVYAQAEKEYGKTDVPVNTFNKVWIIPDDALIYEKNNTAYVLKNHLKVLLEEDYLSLKRHSGISSAPAADKSHSIASKIIKDIVLPELEREVNEGRNFATLRQIYSGMLLAAWYKRALKASLLSKIYADKARVKGIDQNPRNNGEIYRQYLQAYKKGVFNFIREDVDKYTHEVIPRRYFSGGTRAYPGDAAQFAKVVHEITVLNPGQDEAMKAEIDGADVVQVMTTASKVSRPDAAMAAIVQPLIEERVWGNSLGLNQPDWNAYHYREIYQAIEKMVLSSKYGKYLKLARVEEKKLYDQVSKKHHEQMVELYGEHSPRAQEGEDWTVRHQMAVTVNTVNLGIARGMKPNALVINAFAAMLHDYGKVNLPKGLLNSTQKFNNQERKQFESHVKSGEEILKSLNMPAEIIEIVLQHHEQTGGKGYPNGLNEKQMTELGKQLAAADAITALMENRPYKKGYSPQAVVNFLTVHIKDRFDFKTVQAFKQTSGLIHTASFAELRVAQINQATEELRRRTRWSALAIGTPSSDSITSFSGTTPLKESISFGKINPSDKASVSKREPPGGIDLNSAHLDLRIRRDGQGVLIPVSQKELEGIKIEGLSPVIIYIKPAQGLPIFSELQNTAKVP